MSARLDISVRSRRGKVYVEFDGPDVTVEYPLQPDRAREIAAAIEEAADAA